MSKGRVLIDLRTARYSQDILERWNGRSVNSLAVFERHLAACIKQEVVTFDILRNRTRVCVKVSIGMTKRSLSSSRKPNPVV